MGRVFLLCILALFVTFPRAFGQSSRGGGYQRQHRRRFKGPSIDDQVKRLAKQLDLSEAQQFAVKRVLERQREQVERLRSDQSLDPLDRLNKFWALRGNTVDQIAAFLNEDQRKKYDLFRAPRGDSPQRENNGTVR